MPVAIVGMACLFPGAADLDAFWRNLYAGTDAVREAPPSRIDPVFFADTATRTVDRFYCRRGGFLDGPAIFDAAYFGVMPVAARTAEPDQLLTLQVAARALADAGYDERPFARDRAAVILGRGGYVGAGRTRLEQQTRGAEQLVAALRALVPALDEETLRRVRAEFQEQLGSGAGDGAIGLVPNLAASRIANRLDLHGPAYTIDAACASALVAVDQSCRELQSGRSDLVVAGGVHLCLDEAFWSVFCQLGALSRHGEIRPFDRRADGLVFGEGVGIVVLKRLADAERDGDRIYAVVRGCGTSSDGRGTSLMNPAVSGQLLALERAWAESGLDPATAGLIEAHGTGTPAGDVAELTTLARFFGPPVSGVPLGVVGSVKSMIGHAMSAAGAAGFIKAALAIHHGMLLPTLHCEEPHAELQQTRFRVTGSVEPWPGDAGPRRAGVNAFGFGGINAHVVLEEYVAPVALPPRAALAVPAPLERIAAFSAPTIEALLDDLSHDRERTDGGPVRAVVIGPTHERIARTKEIATRAKPWRGRDRIWFAANGLLASGGSIAFVFPGVDAAFDPHVDDIARAFNLRVPRAADSSSIHDLGLQIFEVNRLLNTVLRELGIRPAHVAGHSLGEWSAMYSCGVIPEAALESQLEAVASFQMSGVAFAAAGCGVELAEEAIDGLEKIEISHDNCPHQVLFCGVEASVENAIARLAAKGVLCQKLPFRSGFHSQFLAPYLDSYREIAARTPFAPPREKFWSATTCAPYPSDAEAIRELSTEHLVRRVRFRELVHVLYGEGARFFVQIGNGSVINFVGDILRGSEHVALAANVKERGGMDQLQRLVAALFVEGGDVDIARLSPRTVTKPPMALPLGVPLARNFTALDPVAVTNGSRNRTPEAGAHPLAAEFASSLDAVVAAQREVLARFAAEPLRRSASAARERTIAYHLSIEKNPELLDHTFYAQPPNWPNYSDRRPIVPMTMSLDLMMEHGAAMVPGKIAVGLENVRMHRWLVVEGPTDVEIVCRYDGRERVEVRIEGYSEGTVLLADRYDPPVVADDTPIVEVQPAAGEAERIYSGRWMFHGPAYQGIAEVNEIGREAIRAELVVRNGRGAALDNAGQLFGVWGMLNLDTDQMTLPIGVGRLRFYGSHPPVGARLRCTVRVTAITETTLRANISLDLEGRVWAVAEDWELRRFETDPRLWAVIRQPHLNLLAQPLPAGFTIFEDKYGGAFTRDQLTRIYLGEAERADLAKEGPRSQRSWLNGRIAAKDAIRDLLWRTRQGPIFPIELKIESEASGKPVVRTQLAPGIRVSISHKANVAVAIASDRHDVGIDIERVEPRDEAFVRQAFVSAELALIEGEPRDEALTRLWTAKEAFAKQRGTGLGGDPRRIVVEAREGDRLSIGGQWVQTKRHGDFVIGWTQV